jgi:hypothetical protein
VTHCPPADEISLQTFLIFLVRNLQVYWFFLWYQSLRWLRISWELHFTICVAAPIISLWLAWKLDCSEVFPRAGAVMCFSGGFLCFREYLRGAENEFLRNTRIADLPAFRFLQRITDRMDAKALDTRAKGYGIWFIAIGTLIWGYGDLLLKGVHICDR